MVFSRGSGLATIARMERQEGVASLGLACAPDGIPAVLDRVEGFLEEIQVSRATTLQLRLVVEEILVNAATHGRLPNAADAAVLALGADSSEVRIEIRDRGLAFDPVGEPEIPERRETAGGVGLKLVRALVDELSYARRDGWNILTLTKKLPRSGTEGV